MVSVGTMIGAGYSSGQEIASFFGWSPSFFVPVFCGLLMFAFTAVVLFVGRKTEGGLTDVHRALFGRFGCVADGVMTLNAVIVLGAMIAGTDKAFAELSGFVLPAGIVVCIISMLILRRGNAGLIAANSVIVPFIALCTVAVCASAPLSVGSFSLSEIPASFAYVSMNLLLSAGVLVRQRGLSARQIFGASALSAFVIAALMALICFALPAAPSLVMPMLSLAAKGRITYALYSVSLAVSIFTTLIGALSTAADGAVRKGRGGEGMLAAALFASILSVIGFDKVVGFFYPVIGIMGLVYLGAYAAFLLAPHIKFFRKRDCAVHRARKHAERDRSGHDKVCLEHLPAVNDKIPESRAGYEILAHDSSHPGKTDVDFKHGEKGGNGGRQNRITQDLQSSRAHGAEKQDLVGGGGA